VRENENYHNSLLASSYCPGLIAQILEDIGCWKRLDRYSRGAATYYGKKQTGPEAQAEFASIRGDAHDEQLQTEYAHSRNRAFNVSRSALGPTLDLSGLQAFNVQTHINDEAKGLWGCAKRPPKTRKRKQGDDGEGIKEDTARARAYSSWEIYCCEQTLGKKGAARPTRKQLGPKHKALAKRRKSG